MAKLAGNFSDSERAMVQRALARVPVAIGRTLKLLEGLKASLRRAHRISRRGLPGGLLVLNQPGLRPFHRAFGVDPFGPGAERKIDAVIGAFQGVLKILQSDRCLLSKYTGSGAIWGLADKSALGAGYTWEIQLGSAFFLKKDTGYDEAVKACRPRLKTVDAAKRVLRKDIEFLRVDTLIHEAVHWYNKIGGHSSLGMLRDPYNFDWFLLESTCVVPSKVVDDYRKSPHAQLRVSDRRVSARG